MTYPEGHENILPPKQDNFERLVSDETAIESLSRRELLELSCDICTARKELDTLSLLVSDELDKRLWGEYEEYLDSVQDLRD